MRDFVQKHPSISESSIENQKGDKFLRSVTALEMRQICMEEWAKTHLLQRVLVQTYRERLASIVQRSFKIGHDFVF